LVNKEETQGVYSVAWNAKNELGALVPSGVYFVKLQAGAFSQVRKMLMLK